MAKIYVDFIETMLLLLKKRLEIMETIKKRKITAYRRIIGERVRSLRKGLNLTQPDLAKLIGLSYGYIS